MPRVFSTGIEVPTASDKHPSEAWWSRVGSTTNAALVRMDSAQSAAWKAAVEALRNDSLPRSEASQYGIPGPATTLSVGAVQGGATAAASVTGTAPSQTLNLTLPQGPRGPEGPGGAFQLRETAEVGLFEVSDVPNEVIDASAAEVVARASVGALVSRGMVPAGTDLNTLNTAEHTGTWELVGGRAYVNCPIPTSSSGLLTVSVQRSAGHQKIVRHGLPEMWERSTTFGAWNPWSSAPVVQPIGQWSLDDMRTNADIVISNTANANAITAGWPTGLSRGPVSIRVRAASTGVSFQQIQTYGSDPRLLVRSTSAVSPSPFPWSEWRDVTPVVPTSTGSGAADGLANTMLLQDFTRRRPVVKTGGKGVVALRFDHGLTNFRDKVVPVLKRLGLPAAQALNGGDWDRAENAGVTAADVNAWVAEGWLEIWNHSLNHITISASSEVEAQIKGGLDKLRADLPAAQIDGFMPTGPGPHMSFNGGSTVASWYESEVGRAILRTHAIGEGSIPGTDYRVLDGTPRSGATYLGSTASPLDTIKTRVATAASRRAGVCMMWHPSQLDTEGYISTETLTACLEHIAAERDAGRIQVLGVYDMHRADSRT